MRTIVTCALNNRLQLNLTGVAAASSTSTSISTTVPTHTASGKIKVTTPFGQDVSDGDFFVAPSPYVGSDVQVTGRMGYSQATGVAITTANKIGLIVFDGELGQRSRGTAARIRRSSRDVRTTEPDIISTESASLPTNPRPITGGP